jgi:hypothetical protein
VNTWKAESKKKCLQIGNISFERGGKKEGRGERGDGLFSYFALVIKNKAELFIFSLLFE